MLKPIIQKLRPVHLVMFVVFLVGFLVTGSQFLDAKEVSLILSELRWWMVPPLLLMPAVYLWLKSTRFADLFALSGPRLAPGEVRDVVKRCYASAQMATLLPGGYVARIGLVQSSVGKGTQAVVPTLLEKVIDITLLMTAGLYACCLYPGMESLAGIILSVLVLLSLAGLSSTLRGYLRGLIIALASKIGGEKVADRILQLRAPSLSLGLKLTVQSFLVLSLELAILAGSFAALDASAGILVVILSYAVADVLGRVAPTPGGFGLTEIGMVAFLHKYDGMLLNEAAAVTFLFRFLLFLLPAIYGSFCYLLSLRSLK